MIFIILTIFTLFIVLSHIIFHKQLNILTLTLLIWMISSILMELNLMNIDSVEPRTYIIIFVAFVFILLGAYMSSLTKTRTPNSRTNTILHRRFYTYILLISSTTVIINTILTISRYGGVFQLLNSANSLYAERMAGDYNSGIPYIGSFDLIAASLGGYHLANNKKTVSNILQYFIIPMTTIALDSAINLGRATLMIGFFIYSSSYFYTHYKNKSFRLKLQLKHTIVITSILIGMWYILIVFRDIRGGYEDYHFKKNLPVVEQLDKYGLFRPSIYLYFVSPIAVFDNTIGHTFEHRTWFPLKETFGPIIRMILKPFPIKVERYEAAVNIGIREANTGTMLKDFYMDLGIPGVIGICFMLGFIFHRVTKLWLKSDAYILELSFLSAYLIMSIFMNIFRLGQFVFPLIAILLIKQILKFKWKLL